MPIPPKASAIRSVRLRPVQIRDRQGPPRTQAAGTSLQSCGRKIASRSAARMTAPAHARRYDRRVPNRSSKKPRDVNALARAIVDEATGEAPPSPKPEPEKD